jgi:hypothetical protein
MIAVARLYGFVSWQLTYSLIVMPFAICNKYSKSNEKGFEEVRK